MTTAQIEAQVAQLEAALNVAMREYSAGACDDLQAVKLHALITMQRCMHGDDELLAHCALQFAMNEQAAMSEQAQRYIDLTSA